MHLKKSPSSCVEGKAVCHCSGSVRASPNHHHHLTTCTFTNDNTFIKNEYDQTWHITRIVLYVLHIIVIRESLSESHIVDHYIAAVNYVCVHTVMLIVDSLCVKLLTT